MNESKQRRAIRISGLVQGVGFRPFVYSLATSLGLSGFVRNQSGTVLIEVEGCEANLDRFVQRLRSDPPRLAKISELDWQPIALQGERPFQIESSVATAERTIFVSPDIATCSDCRRELLDPGDRRFRYPFLNCTNCGPRLTIIRGAPYDRGNTTMSAFALCEPCESEYHDVNNRRFHAQPIACPLCGPSLRLLSADGRTSGAKDPLAAFVQETQRNKIGAIKGLGGYHLTCLARNQGTVGRLRERKHRDEKPFAIMIRDATVAAGLCEMDDQERRLLESASRPIVLLRKKAVVDRDFPRVAPNNACLGVMLPYTPLHELLFDAIGDEPLVMTSGNRSDEPIACDDDDAVGRLTGIADLFLVHNRPIQVRCDDSVMRIINGKESPIRRSRGYAPVPVCLPLDVDRPVLAVGGQLKVAFALAAGSHAFVSHHMGDLGHVQAFQAFRRDIDLYEQLFEIQPQVIVHDLHPDYASTRYAIERSRYEGIQCLGVQHHHAHLASCMAEHQLDGQVIGVVFDGSGLGTDGTIWGGEFLVGGYDTCRRAAHLRPIRLPGGDQATKEPWRVALSYLDDAGCDVDDLLTGESTSTIQVLRQMIRRGVNSPWSSSAGRLFDSVAAILGIRHVVSFEGQAAVELEGLAIDATCEQAYAFRFDDVSTTSSTGFQVDTRPAIRQLVADRNRAVDTNVIARRFHNTLGEVILRACKRLRSDTGLNRVVLSGGVFMNEILSTRVAKSLTENRFDVFGHHLVPANDGGLCLGQLAIAARSRAGGRLA